MGRKVSIYGKDQHLLEIRALVLSRAGFVPVLNLVNEGEVADTPLADTSQYLLCTSFSPVEQSILARTIESRDAAAKIILIRQPVHDLSMDPEQVRVCGHEPRMIVDMCRKVFGEQNT